MEHITIVDIYNQKAVVYNYCLEFELYENFHQISNWVNENLNTYTICEGSGGNKIYLSTDEMMAFKLVWM